MKMLMLHVDYFRSTITEKGRSKLVEALDLSSKVTEVGESLVVLASVERADEHDPETVAAKLASYLNSRASGELCSHLLSKY